MAQGRWGGVSGSGFESCSLGTGGMQKPFILKRRFKPRNTRNLQYNECCYQPVISRFQLLFSGSVPLLKELGRASKVGVAINMALLTELSQTAAFSASSRRGTPGSPRWNCSTPRLV